MNGPVYVLGGPGYRFDGLGFVNIKDEFEDLRRYDVHVDSECLDGLLEFLYGTGLGDEVDLRDSLEETGDVTLILDDLDEFVLLWLGLKDTIIGSSEYVELMEQGIFGFTFDVNDLFMLDDYLDEVVDELKEGNKVKLRLDVMDRSLYEGVSIEPVEDDGSSWQSNMPVYRTISTSGEGTVTFTPLNDWFPTTDPKVTYSPVDSVDSFVMDGKRYKVVVVRECGL